MARRNTEIIKIKGTDLISESIDKINTNFESLAEVTSIDEQKWQTLMDETKKEIDGLKESNNKKEIAISGLIRDLNDKVDNVPTVDNIQQQVNSAIKNADRELSAVISTLAGQYVNNALGDYAKAADLDGIQTAFESFSADAKNNIATASITAANSKFYTTYKTNDTIKKDKYLVYIDDSKNIYDGTSPYKNIYEYYDVIKTTIDPENKGYGDSEIATKLLTECEKTFKTVSTEMATIKQTVADGFASIDIVATVKKTVGAGDTYDDEGKNITAAIFATASENGSEIKLTADNITINGDHKLNLSTGTFTVTGSNFSVDDSGSVSMAGTITATSGSIGGITIASNSIHSENNHFSVDSSGYLTASNANISGNITATSLTIAEPGQQEQLISDYVGSKVSIALNDIFGGSDGNYDWFNSAMHKTSVSGGLVLTGNLLVGDINDNITAGVLGGSTSNSDNLRFFAGRSQTDASNAPFRVYSDGRLVATKAEIEGDIIASAFKSSYNESSELTKDTELNGELFRISATGSVKDEDNNPVDVTGNSVYIKIVNKLKDEDGTIVSSGENLYGVPVLCMNYNGTEYVLSPASWIRGEQPEVFERNMTWVFAYNVHNWTVHSDAFNTYSNYCYSGSLLNSSTNIGTYYVFQDNKTYFITGDSDIDKLYRFSIADINQNDDEYDSLLNKMAEHNLINNTSAKKGSLTLRSKITRESDLGRTTIDEPNCQRFEGYLQSSINTAAVGSWSYTADSSFLGEFNFRSALTIIKDILLGGRGNTYNWYQNNAVVSVPNTYKLTPFMSDDASTPGTGVYPTDYNTTDDRINININYYPLFTITNKGKTINSSTDTILLKLKYTTTCTYSGASFMVNNHNITPQSGNFEFEFYSVFSLNSPISFDLDSIMNNAIFNFITGHLKDIICENFTMGKFTFNGNVTCTDSNYNLTIHS